MRATSSRNAELVVSVNGRRWQYVPDLADSGPRDRDFTVVQTADGNTIVQFGDGVQGARPPVGGEIKVQYRAGGGNTVAVSLRRTASDPTLDQALWVAIRNRTRAISFEFGENRREARPKGQRHA